VKHNSKLDIKKINIKKLTPVAHGDNSEYCDEIGRALDTAGSKIANQDMKDLFKDKVNSIPNNRLLWQPNNWQNC
jgi:hypothetical protein